MSLAVALLITNRALQAAHPEMSHADRSMLAAELVRDGHVTLRSDNASVMFDDEARRRAPRLPYCSDMVLNAKIARARETCEVVKAAIEPISLSAMQRRVREWADYNFPLKVTDEHRRMAREFLDRRFAYTADDIESLAYLLAARENRSHRQLLGAIEELGELCHAHLKQEQGVRGSHEEHQAAKKDAIGDALIYILDYCNKEGLDAEECLETAWLEISSRDWIRFPKNGKTE